MILIYTGDFRRATVTLLKIKIGTYSDKSRHAHIRFVFKGSDFKGGRTSRFLKEAIYIGMIINLSFNVHISQVIVI